MTWRRTASARRGTTPPAPRPGPPRRGSTRPSGARAGRARAARWVWRASPCSVRAPRAASTAGGGPAPRPELAGDAEAGSLTMRSPWARSRPVWTSTERAAASADAARPRSTPSPRAPRRRRAGSLLHAGVRGRQVRVLPRAARMRRSDSRASSMPMACGCSSGRRRASQPTSVIPARRVASGRQGSPRRRMMSAISRVRCVSSVTLAPPMDWIHGRHVRRTRSRAALYLSPSSRVHRIPRCAAPLCRRVRDTRQPLYRAESIRRISRRIEL